MIDTDPDPRSTNHTLSNYGLTRFFNSASAAVGLKGEVDVLLADDSTLRRLNKNFRGKNKPTDVLSFPAAAEISQLHAGDLVNALGKFPETPPHWPSRLPPARASFSPDTQIRTAASTS